MTLRRNLLAVLLTVVLGISISAPRVPRVPTYRSASPTYRRSTVTWSSQITYRCFLLHQWSVLWTPCFPLQGRKAG